MSSHDCRVTGFLPLKEGVTDCQIKAVLKEFLSEHGLSYAHEASAGNIEIDNRSLSLSLDIYGHGGYENESVDALADRLGRIVDEGGHFEFLDFDTGSTDEACTPYFVGTNEAAKQRAQLSYGIEQMEQWVRPIVGDDAFEVIKQLMIGRTPRHIVELKDGEDAKLFMQELLESVETLTGIADEYGARTLADLMYLQQVILSGGFIDHRTGESNVLEIASALPSGKKWTTFIKVDYMAS